MSIIHDFVDLSLLFSIISLSFSLTLPSSQGLLSFTFPILVVAAV